MLQEINLQASWSEISPLISLLATVVSLLSAWHSWQSAKSAEKLQSEALSLQRGSLDLEFDKLIIGWASEVITTIADVRSGVDHGPDDVSLLNQKKRELSVLLNRGRFFFPNIDDTSKPGAYRAPILDLLMVVIRSLDQSATTGVFENRYFERVLDGVERSFRRKIADRLKSQLSVFSDADWGAVHPLIQDFEQQYGVSFREV